MRDTVGVGSTYERKGAAASASVRSLFKINFHRENSVFFLVLFIRIYDCDYHQFCLTIDQSTIAKL
jgi:hypothetical protein